MSVDAVLVERDVVYGSGLVGLSRPGGPTHRQLKLDVYRPADPGAAPRPAVIMAFGGAFHRGSKEDDQFGDERGRNTPIAEYCRWLASLGYVAFAIDYRLTTEDPDPGNTLAISAPDAIPTSRMDYVRSLLSLPPADSLTLWRGIEAAIDDMVMAFGYVASQHGRFWIDPSRIAVGGFSAGARLALYAALAEGVPAAAVVSMSGYIDPSDLRRPAPTRPRVLLIAGEHDLDYVMSGTPIISRQLRESGYEQSCWIVPGASHFYPESAQLPDRTTPTVAARIALFLRDAFAEPATSRDAALLPAPAA